VCLRPRVFVLLQQGVIKNADDLARFQGDFHLLFDVGVPNIYQKLQAVVFFFQIAQLDDLQLTHGALHVVDVKLGKVAGHDSAGPLGVGQFGGIPLGLLERGEQRAVRLLDGLIQFFAQAPLFNEDMGRRDEAINKVGMIQHDLIFKRNELVRLGYTVDLLEPGQPKGLAVVLLIAFSSPVRVKLFCGGAALYICGGVPPIVFYRIP